jgi:hypothetical protein
MKTRLDMASGHKKRLKTVLLLGEKETPETARETVRKMARAPHSIRM